MLTACGIETKTIHQLVKQILFVATVLTACGIETAVNLSLSHNFLIVATVLTACGIETIHCRLVEPH